MSDPLREQDLGPNTALIIPAIPKAEFKLPEPYLKEVEEVIKAARSASSPGPVATIPRLQALSRALPKEEDSKNINQEGKVFFSIFSRRLTEFLLKNNYTDPTVQKSGIPGAPSCLKHTDIVTQLIREVH